MRIAITIHKVTKKILGLLLVPINKEKEQFFTDLNYFMPIDKEWKVVWGDDTLLTNYHSNISSQKYAYDLLIEKENKTYSDEGKHNEDYFAYNQNIVAPHAGVVVDVRSNIKDNQPGVMNEKQLLGNYVIIRHGEQEYSLIAHFMPNSIVVTPGQSVKSGDLLGRCGNSGHSSEPHIHFQVMTTPLLSEDCLSKKIKFENLKSPLSDDIVTGRISTKT
ncbi:M23 family metallopeptidase [Staphylococcus sp. Marseille-Q1834]|uniref:M23 family metallopeptidase n=1 Tax=Staphylococcus sp. Marseille-Q1834 TaxID=2866594 RepID=UPI0012B758EF|nr:M23 family metallopeptidase [Staphylococcus sp. Marseille-Q1834]